ncbi:annexin ANXC4 [Diplocarpon rosae]|nr:annexin ANXC4 [Diplocarpon rosae]
MSLDPRDDRRRGRSKSPGRRKSSRSRSRVKTEGDQLHAETARLPREYEERGGSAAYGYAYGRGEALGRGGGRGEVVTAEPRGYGGGIWTGGSEQYRDPDPLAYPEPQSPAGRQYSEPAKWEYAKPDESISYSKGQDTAYNSAGGYGDEARRGRGYSPPRQEYRHGSHASASIRSSSRSRYGSAPQYISDPARSSQSKIVTVEPGRRRDASPNRASLTPRMHSLSVSTGHHGGTALNLSTAPGSPLLEAYHGTYQSISPMPSPLMMPPHPNSDINLIEPLSPSSSDSDSYRRDQKSRRTARFHDPETEAAIFARALRGEKRTPDTAPLIEILPGLTHAQVLSLRVEYKKIVKAGSEKKGVNVAKHIKLRLKDEDPMLMKACYACALGRWESEAYWANFWYQGEKSRRELLIESLMGRPNAEIRAIKAGFSDKKYSDSLTKCMQTELKEDKFKKAVLMVLEERKVEERPGARVNGVLVDEDVRDLYRAVKSERGGESAMIGIVCVRSDDHLREVLRTYQAVHRANFAKEMLRKSGNLVGELLAHILNGVINKPVRDALLLHHALSLSQSQSKSERDNLRTELLISRLVRYHWDRPHMELVKKAYRERYGVELQRAVREGTRGEWGLFCEGLCVRRMGDEVRQVRGW